MLLQTETSSTPLPARLIDVGLDDTQSPRLVDTAGQTGIYVALSHCWGSWVSPQTRLTKSSMSTLQQSIEPSTIPRWGRDAIVLARSLGVQYIWIDTLCIVQDDQEECLITISKFPDIYRSAVLTIAAVGTDDETVGSCIDNSLLGQPFSIFLDWSRPTVAKSFSDRLFTPNTLSQSWTLQEMIFQKGWFVWTTSRLQRKSPASDNAIATQVNKADTPWEDISDLERLHDSEAVEPKEGITHLRFDEASREIEQGVHHVEASKTFEALALFMKARELVSTFQPLTPRSWTIHAVASANIALVYQMQLLPAMALDIVEASLSVHRRLPIVDCNCTLE